MHFPIGITKCNELFLHFKQEIFAVCEHRARGNSDLRYNIWLIRNASEEGRQMASKLQHIIYITAYHVTVVWYSDNIYDILMTHWIDTITNHYSPVSILNSFNSIQNHTAVSLITSLKEIIAKTHKSVMLHTSNIIIINGYDPCLTFAVFAFRGL